MKVIVASYQCESNSLAKIHPGKEDFEYFRGDDIFKKLVVKDVFEENGIEVVPAVYAVALPAGTVTQDIYYYYFDQIMETVIANPDAEGVYIYFHGSMEVDGIGSGELFLLKAIKKVIPNAVIAVTFDAHANVTDELNSYADIVCGYKTVPHVDQPESQIRAAKALSFCLNNGIRPVTATVRVPFLLKNDTVLTGIEPLKSLIEETLELEKQDDVLSVNLFLGHCWIDAPNTSASTVVTALSKEKAESIAKDMANKLWATRKIYKFKIEAESAEECVKRAIEGKENRIFITDSGDNTTAGAEGDTTEILRLFLKTKLEKKVCVAGITDKEIVDEFWDKKDGEKVYLDKFGVKATVKSHGDILGWTKEIIGRSLAFSIDNLDVVFTEYRSAFIEIGNFEKANVNLLEYRIVVVKLGYLFTELKPYADRELFALTDGASCVELERLNLKNILRPMYPLEDFEWKA